LEAEPSERAILATGAKGPVKVCALARPVEGVPSPIWKLPFPHRRFQIRPPLARGANSDAG
jgi:hypothetical protein